MMHATSYETSFGVMADVLFQDSKGVLKNIWPTYRAFQRVKRKIEYDVSLLRRHDIQTTVQEVSLELVVRLENTLFGEQKNFIIVPMRKIKSYEKTLRYLETISDEFFVSVLDEDDGKKIKFSVIGENLLKLFYPDYYEQIQEYSKYSKLNEKEEADIADASWTHAKGLEHVKRVLEKRRELQGPNIFLNESVELVKKWESEGSDVQIFSVYEVKYFEEAVNYLRHISRYLYVSIFWDCNEPKAMLYLKAGK